MLLYSYPIIQIPATINKCDYYIRYDNKTRKTHDNDGVEIRVPGWGNPKYVEYLDSAEDTTGLYFGKIADKLVRTGYVRGRNLFGAPYDFRKAASKSC